MSPMNCNFCSSVHSGGIRSRTRAASCRHSSSESSACAVAAVSLRAARCSFESWRACSLWKSSPRKSKSGLFRRFFSFLFSFFVAVSVVFHKNLAFSADLSCCLSIKASHFAQLHARFKMCSGVMTLLLRSLWKLDSCSLLKLVCKVSSIDRNSSCSSSMLMSLCATWKGISSSLATSFSANSDMHTRNEMIRAFQGQLSCAGTAQVATNGNERQNITSRKLISCA